MRKKLILFSLCLLLIVCFPVVGQTCDKPLTITGLVKHPMTLTADDLAKFQATIVRSSDIRKDGTYHGVFTTRGVPLKNLLELAVIRKGEGGFDKPLDLTIVVSNKEGKKVSLSWGEVFYRNPGDTTVAFSSAPVMPHKDCTGCHSPDFYKPYLDQLTRKVCLPRLVVSKDFDSDRSLEGIVSIEVVNPSPAAKTDRKAELSSRQVTVTGRIKKPLTITDLSAFPRKKVTVNTVGDGRGFHGRNDFEGTPVAEILSRAGIEPDLGTVVVFSAPDGYRSLISYGELYLSPQGERIMIVDRANGAPLAKNGKFLLVLPDDLAADRQVKALEKIEVISVGGAVAR